MQTSHSKANSREPINLVLCFFSAIFAFRLLDSFIELHNGLREFPFGKSGPDIERNILEFKASVADEPHIARTRGSS